MFSQFKGSCAISNKLSTIFHRIIALSSNRWKMVCSVFARWLRQITWLRIISWWETIRVMFTCLLWRAITLDWNNVKAKKTHNFRSWTPKLSTCKLLILSVWQLLFLIWVFSGLNGGLAFVYKLTPPNKENNFSSCNKYDLLFVMWRKCHHFQ